MVCAENEGGAGCCDRRPREWSQRLLWVREIVQLLVAVVYDAVVQEYSGEEKGPHYPMYHMLIASV